MAELTERQLRAQALCRELLRLGAHVVSPLPLDPDKHLRFQVLDVDRAGVLEQLGKWGWKLPALVSSGPRFCPDGVKQASLYELHIEPERQPVLQDRTIRGNVAEREKTSAEVMSVRRYLGMK